MKKLLISFLLLLSTATFACPDLRGTYRKCYSEVRPIKGEYLVEQHQENYYEIYKVQYNDDESDEHREDVLKTNGSLESRKETLPRVGVTVRIDSRSRCEKEAVVSDANVYFLGAKVGTVTTKIFVEDGKLKSNIDGGYLGGSVHKRIVCDLRD